MCFPCSEMSYLNSPSPVVGSLDTAPHLSQGRMFAGAHMTLFRKSGAEEGVVLNSYQKCKVKHSN